MTNRILALVDHSPYAESVCHHSAWIAQRLGAEITLLHVLARNASAGSDDLSGSLKLGARTALLEKLAELDVERARLAKAQGQALLEDASTIIEGHGAGPVTQKLRQGDLVETVAELEPKMRAIVLGKRGEGSAEASAHLGSNLERIVRSASVPVLVASRRYQPVSSILIAFDASPSAERAVDRMAASPVFTGLAATLVHVGKDGPEIRARLQAAKDRLAAAGVPAAVEILPGHPEAALAHKIATDKITLLVMGAYGDSRIRNLIIGSTTTAMIQACKIPVLLFR